MTPESVFFISAMVWGFLLGVFIGFDKPSKILVSIVPKKAPPPEAFKKE
tara:strand:- start:934 stop:1080 length:147 start_codon:yes stop_codon:yes gene_type:complete